MPHNPYAPPGDYREDFRAAAVRESERLVEENGGRIPEGRSLCLPAADADPGVLRDFRRGVVLRNVLGFSTLPMAALCVFLKDTLFDGPQDGSWLLVMALCIMIAGVFVFLSDSFFCRRFVSRRVGQRCGDLMPVPGKSKPMLIGIEDPMTSWRPEMVPEDLGYMMIDPLHRVVVIEGVLFRYLIHTRDVQAVDEARVFAGVGVVVSACVGTEILGITLSQEAAWGHAARLKRLQEALTTDSPPPNNDSEEALLRV